MLLLVWKRQDGYQRGVLNNYHDHEGGDQCARHLSPVARVVPWEANAAFAVVVAIRRLAVAMGKDILESNHALLGIELLEICQSHGLCGHLEKMMVAMMMIKIDRFHHVGS